MNRRELGRGRLIASAGALLTLVAIWLPWWRVGGTPGLPESSGIGLSGAGIVVLLSAVLILVLVALPFAAGDRPVPLDRPASFVVITAVGVVALAFSVFQLFDAGGFPGGLGLPDRSPGLWLAAVGLAVAAWGTAEIVSERPSR